MVIKVKEIEIVKVKISDNLWGFASGDVYWWDDNDDVEETIQLICYQGDIRIFTQRGSLSHTPRLWEPQVRKI